MDENVKSLVYETPLPDGFYNWYVNAGIGQGKTQSDIFTFEVCTLKCDGTFNLIYPENNEIVTNSSIEFVWEEPVSCSKCGDTSKYSYTLTIYKGNDVKYSGDVREGQKRFVFSFDEDYEYSWKIEAFGPDGLITGSGLNYFTLCTPEKSDSPTELKTDKTDKSGITPCIASYGDLPYTFTWKKPEKYGKSCTGSDTNIVEYRLQIKSQDSSFVFEKNITANPDNYLISYEMDFACDSELYAASVQAWNGYAYSDPAAVDFGVCERSAPEDIGTIEVNTGYCRATTEVTWDYNEWGKTCSNSNEKNKFLFTFTRGEEMSPEIVPYQENGAYNREFSLAEGDWEMEVVASNKDGLTSNPITRKFTVYQIPDIRDVSVQNLGTGVKFAWKTDNNLYECAKDALKYKLEYEDNNKNSSILLDVNENMEHTINDVSGTIIWCIKLVDGDKVLKQFKCDVYSTDDNCVPVKPSWNDPDDALITPDGKDPMFGEVTFEWKEPKPGISCKKETQENGEEGTRRRRDVVDTNADRGFYVYVGEQKETSDKASRVIEIEGYGNRTWYVVAFVGDVTSEPTKSKTFCYSPSPEVPKLKEYDPLNPNFVSWEEVSCKTINIHSYTLIILLFFAVSNPCGLEYGYIIRYGAEKHQEYVDKNQTQFDLAMYSDKSVVWSVESYIGNVSSGKNETNTTLCNYNHPNPPILSSVKKADVIDKNYLFSWSNPNKITESCGVELEYTYNIIIKNGDIVIYSNRTTETSVSVELETGEYSWEISTCNGIYNSSTSKSTLSFCYSEELG